MLSWACALATKPVPASAQTKVAPRANLWIRIAFLLARSALRRAWPLLGSAFVPILPARPELLPEYAPSVGVGPHSELLFGELPQPRQSVRLDDQEEDDEGTNDHELQVFDGGRVDRDAEGLGSSAQKHRQSPDEGCTHERSNQAAEPANDHHEQDEKGFVDVEALEFRGAQP